MFVCCGAALYLLHQLLLPVAWLWRRPDGSVIDSAVTWRPGVVAESAGGGRRMISALVAFEGAALILSGIAAFMLTRAPASAAAFDPLLRPLCGTIAGAG